MKLSASQISTWNRCLRRGALQYVWQKKPLVVAPALTFGSNFHHVAETYLRTGEIADDPSVPEAMVRAAIPVWNELREIEDLEVESYFCLPLTDDIYIRGYRDFRSDIENVFGDHKTIGGRVTPSVGVLKSDIQVNLYAWAEFETCAGDEIDALWIYYPKPLPHRPVKVPFSLTRDAVTSYVEREVVPRAEEIHLIRSELDSELDDPQKIPANLSACGGCGRWCDVSDYCDRTKLGLPKNEFLATLRRRKDNDMSFLDELRKRQAEQAAMQAQGEPAVNPPEQDAALEKVVAETVAPEPAPEPPASAEPAPEPEKKAKKGRGKTTVITAAPGQQIEITIKVVG